MAFVICHMLSVLVSVDDAVSFESSDLMFLNACNLGEAFVRGSCNCKLGQGWVKTQEFPLSFVKESKNNSNISNMVKKVYCAKRVIALYISSFPSFPFSSLAPDSPQDSQSSVGSPLSRVGPQIIGAEDDDFDTEQEQVGMTFSLSHPFSPLTKILFLCA